MLGNSVLGSSPLGTPGAATIRVVKQHILLSLYVVVT